VNPAESPTMEFEATRRVVGRYSIVRELGRGGMAVVYLARQKALNREVALKELREVPDDDPALAERFLRESRLSGSFTHPNIVTVFDYFEAGGNPFIAMEYLERGSIRPLVGRLSVPQIAGVLEDVLAGLAQAELQGVVHRDLKPENLLVSAEGRVKIADFGIAKALQRPQHGVSLTETGVVIGTPSYMAPEQALDEQIGPYTDLYATGVIAYELLLGRLPFGPPDPPIAILFKHVNERVPSPRKLRPDLDPGLVAWLERMLAKQPTRRPAGAQQAWEELEDVVLTLYGPRWRREARLVEDEPRRPSAPPRPALPPPPPPEEIVGPTVVPDPPRVETEAEPQPPLQPTRRRVWPTAGLATAIAAVLVLAFQSPPAPARVALPALTGMSESEAVDAIHALGLEVDTRRVPRIRIGKGIVFRQEPRSGARLGSGGSVTLLVSAGKPKVKVPDVVGEPLARAKKALLRRHLHTRVVRVHDVRPTGSVVGQSVSAGGRVPWGSRVTLRVSKGPPLVVVPSLYGLSYTDARARLEALGLAVARVTTGSSRPAETVVGQGPSAGESVRRGQTVTVYVATAPVIVEPQKPQPIIVPHIH
jgi:beta-lactam-binding protein with PASTA domain/tRNA A-37 threonylcarbamoyl transferase component Bud32